ncbi:MAG: hypothetical protein WCR76_10605 [Sphaerochaetaceae bacterium]
MGKEVFSVRALELHSLYAWDYEWILRCLDFMVRENYNTLVLHRNDFVDMIVYPGRYFGCKKDSYASIFERYKEIYRTLYKYTPTRRSGPYQRRAFLKRVLEQANRRNIQVYIENKELYFPDIILEFHPEVVKNGKICANDPFWLEFTSVKYQEFFEEFPEISGIITAPATGESRISITSNRCTCDLCRKTPKEVWFKNILEAMYKPIHKAGKRLVVRDFVFNPETHKEIASVMEHLPDDVIISLKNTPHDYYPTFPENSRIGHVGNHEQWIEFDAMGQYFGWGVCIADLTEDYRTRMRHAKERGVSGVIFRTDWESLDGHTVFRNPNLINMYAGGMLAEDLAAGHETVCDRYLSHEGWYAEGTSKEQKQKVCTWVAGLFGKTWSIASKTPFVEGCVFSDSSLIPISYGHAFWLSEEKNSLKVWDSSKALALAPMKANLQEALAEAEEASKEALELCRQAKEGSGEGLKSEKIKWLQDRLMLQRMYVDLFTLVKHALLTTRYLRETKEPKGPFYQEQMAEYHRLMDALQIKEQELRLFHRNTDYRPHTVYTLLDPDRVACLRNDLLEGENI